MFTRKLFVILIMFMFTFSFPILLQDNKPVKAFSGNGSGTAEDPYQITEAEELNEIRDNLGVNYILMNDIDLSGCENWNGGEGFEPIGDDIDPFTGSFNGDNNIISNLYINETASYQGLFEYVVGATIENVGLIDSSVTGDDNVGGLVGYSESSTITDCYSTGNVIGGSYAGGLVGYSESSTITDCYSTGNVIGGSYAGGLIGLSASSTIENCYATGNVIGDECVGGLVGYSESSTIENCYATGEVLGTEYVGGLIGYLTTMGQASIYQSYATGDVISEGNNVGGLVGYNQGDDIQECYATGNVVGRDYVGGLVGYNNEGYINNSYARGDTSGDDYIGGLVGFDEDGEIVNCYSTGFITGDDAVGGLIGDKDDWGTITNSYWDNETSDQTTSDGGEGRTTNQMTYPYEDYDPPCSGLYEDWDMGYCDDGTIWNHDTDSDINDGYPYLDFQCCCDDCNISDINWSNIIDPIGDMFQDIMGYDDNLLGIFILLIFLIMTVLFGLTILIGTVVLIPALFAVFQYIPPLRIIVAIILGLIFGMGLHKLFRR